MRFLLGAFVALVVFVLAVYLVQLGQGDSTGHDLSGQGVTRIKRLPPSQNRLPPPENRVSGPPETHTQPVHAR